MERLSFGARARRKARWKRLKPWMLLASALMMAMGVPGANVGADTLQRLSGFDRSELRGIETTESAAGLMKFRGGTFQSRPEPTPEPTPTPAPVVEAPAAVTVAAPPAPAGSITAIIYAAAEEYGLSGSYLLSVAACESGLNPSAVNPAGYHGLFQFSTSTWASQGYGSIYDPVAQARTAARMLAAGGAGAWPNCA
ncbi:MAG TPA: transglycosylase family protein [Actinomycetota bacterium]|nr:transglycosylase family protein [Actinomycetota bacterium]